MTREQQLKQILLTLDGEAYSAALNAHHGMPFIKQELRIKKAYEAMKQAGWVREDEWISADAFPVNHAGEYWLYLYDEDNGVLGIVVKGYISCINNELKWEHPYGSAMVSHYIKINVPKPPKQ